MTRRILIACLASVLLTLLTALSIGMVIRPHPADQTAPAPEQPAKVRFAAVDVFIDSRSDALAAYQFELAVEKGQAIVVGLEGGEHAAFKEPPYYDPAALMGSRIIVAAFNTGDALPTGKTRVARLHMQITGETAPQYAVKLDVAARKDGEKIAATASVADVPPAQAPTSAQPANVQGEAQ